MYCAFVGSNLDLLTTIRSMFTLGLSVTHSNPSVIRLSKTNEGELPYTLHIPSAW